MKYGFVVVQATPSSAAPCGSHQAEVLLESLGFPPLENRKPVKPSDRWKSYSGGKS